MKSYGITSRRQSADKIESHLESLEIKGYSIEESYFDESECEKLVQKLEAVYQQQVTESGLSQLSEIDELDIARMPFAYDRSFLDLLKAPLVTDVVKSYIGQNYQLHLQNGIINRGKTTHHQTSWHRDLPYQDWVISKPIAVNAFICLTDFTSENGATAVLPHSHRIDYFPSDNYLAGNFVQLVAKAGSIVFFDSMIYHRASYNQTDNVRIGLNNMFVVPIIKQQIDIPRFLEQTELSSEERQLLGFNYQTPVNVKEFRINRLERKRK